MRCMDHRSLHKVVCLKMIVYLHDNVKKHKNEPGNLSKDKKSRFG